MFFQKLPPHCIVLCFRNKRVRKEAAEERKKIFTRRIDNHVFAGKVSTIPTILQFHPFDQQIAIAERDSFTVLDWGRGAKVWNTNNTVLLDELCNCNVFLGDAMSL